MLQKLFDENGYLVMLVPFFASETISQWLMFVTANAALLLQDTQFRPLNE